MAQFRQRWSTPPTYGLEVSGGYVRLVRSGGTRQRFQPRRYRLGDDGDWLDVTDEPDSEALDAAAETEAEAQEQLAATAAGPPVGPPSGLEAGLRGARLRP